MSADERLPMVRQNLARRAGEGATSDAIAEAAISTWKEVAIHLAPIIGEGGVGSLYARSLHLTRASFPWLADGSALESTRRVQQSDWPFMDLRTSLAQREPADASSASSALLNTFLELLAALIGEPLTARLLRPLSNDAGFPLAQEIKQ